VNKERTAMTAVAIQSKEHFGKPGGKSVAEVPFFGYSISSVTQEQSHAINE